MRPTKPVEYSLTERTHLLRYDSINGAGRLFGGKLIAWIDEVASITARRHAQIQVTTAAIDNLQFKNPAVLDDLVYICGRVTYVGNSSMEVRVDSYVEDYDGMRRPINRAYFTIVTVDENGYATQVPYGLEVKTEAQKAEWEGALKRIENRKMRRREGY